MNNDDRPAQGPNDWTIYTICVAALLFIAAVPLLWRL